jgi:hypothetical protein
MATLRRKFILTGFLVAARLLLGGAVARPQEKAPDKAPEKKGSRVEVLDQNNQWIKFELLEVGPTSEDAAFLNFTRKLAPTLDEITWYEIPLAPNPKRGARLREIRLADAPLKFKDFATGKEYLFHPVVLVPFTGFTASWYWQGEHLSGVARAGLGVGAAPRRVSIPIRDVKLVRFVKEP